MSKPVKDMISADYQRRFGELEGAVVVDIRGIAANENNEMRQALAERQVRVMVVKNTLAHKAFNGTPLEALQPALEGPSALAYGAESVVDVARAVVEWAKKIKSLELKGAAIDGEYFPGAAGVKRLSEFPTREEAQARVVTLALSPARNLMGAATSPGSTLLAIVKTIEERLEKGEAIEKAG